jgi:hypothetical protein
LIARALPARPNLEHLKRAAKQRLESLRRTAPDAKLADAQFHLARDYGFASWRSLKAEIDRRARDGAAPAGRHGRWVGWYRHDPDLIRNGILAVTEDGAALSAQLAEGPVLRLEDQGDGVFTPRGVPGRYEFLASGSAPAAALVIHGEGGSIRLERCDEAEARAGLAAAAAARVAQARPRTAMEVAAESLDRWVGWYSTRHGPALEITREDARLFARVSGQQKAEVFPETDALFFFRITPAQLCFELKDGRAVAVVLHQSGLEQRLPRVSAEQAQRAGALIEQKAQAQRQPRTAIEVDAAKLAGYVGRYRLDAGRTLTVTAEGERLFIEITDQERFEVYAESDRDFFWTVAAAQISFVTDNTGRAAGAVLHQAGRDLPLGRIESETQREIGRA